MLEKIIKEIKENEYTYRLGYDLWNDCIIPCIEVYKDDICFSEGYWGHGKYNGLFFFRFILKPYYKGTVNTIKEMFIELRRYSEIPEYIEKEYEDMFILYKLNNFKELNINV